MNSITCPNCEKEIKELIFHESTEVAYLIEQSNGMLNLSWHHELYGETESICCPGCQQEIDIDEMGLSINFV